MTLGRRTLVGKWTCGGCLDVGLAMQARGCGMVQDFVTAQRVRVSCLA